jgi:chromosomal replication initiator protein
MPTQSLSPSLWETVKCDFKSLFPEDVFHMWFEPIVCLETSEELITLGVPNEFASIWINDNYLDLITQRLRLVAGRLVHVKINTTGATPSATSERAGADSALARSRASAGATRKATRYDERGPAAGLLNPRNTFETFVVGSNSQMAHAAALAVAQSPAQAYNPLFLYGDTGLGKTHLMHAIGHAILRRKPDARVAYLSTEKFTNEFIQALQENSLTKFRQRYRQADVLLLDDARRQSARQRQRRKGFDRERTAAELGRARNQHELVEVAALRRHVEHGRRRRGGGGRR